METDRFRNATARPSPVLVQMSTSKDTARSAAKTKVGSILQFQKSGRRLTLGQAADLERIRNNQRRCRARQKEYIAELENKIRQYESASGQSSTDPKLQELVRENELLKRLLHSLGLGSDFLKAYSKAADIAPDISRAQLGDGSCGQAKACSPSSLSLMNLQVRGPHTYCRAARTLIRPA